MASTSRMLGAQPAISSSCKLARKGCTCYIPYQRYKSTKLKRMRRLKEKRAWQRELAS